MQKLTASWIVAGAVAVKWAAQTSKAALLFLLVILPSQAIGATASNASSPRNNTYAIFSLPKDDRVWPALDSLGVGWVRLQYQVGQTNPQQALQAFSRVLNEGYGLWLTLYHRDRTNIADTQRFDTSTRGSFPAADSTIYKNLLRNTIQPLTDLLSSQNRNPGDWLVVQYANEVAPEDVLPPSPQRFFHGTSDAYLAALALTYHAVKSVDSAIPVAFGGISSRTLETILAYNRNPVDSLKKIVDWNDRLLREGRFDWADLHLYHALASIPDKVAWVRARWQGPLASSEIGGPDERTGVDYSEALQAQELPPRIRTAVDAGVDRVFWSFLVDLNIPGDRLAQTLGLIASDWRFKPAYFAYRDLIADAVTSVATTPTPKDFVLLQNYPNPFNPSTRIRYSVVSVQFVRLKIYDILGREVATLVNQQLAIGNYEVQWNGRDDSGRPVGSGIYIYSLLAGDLEQRKRMVVVR